MANLEWENRQDGSSDDSGSENHDDEDKTEIGHVTSGGWKPEMADTAK